MKNLGLLIVLIIFSRLVFFSLDYDPYAIDVLESNHLLAWERAGNALLSPGLYSEQNQVVQASEGTFTYNYLPLWGLITAAALHIPLPYAFIFHGLMLLADIAVALLIYGLLKNKKVALVSATVYALHPMTLWTSTFFHQFDALVLVFILASYVMFTKNKVGTAILLLSIASMFKIFALFILPIYLVRLSPRKILTYLPIFAIPLALITFPFILTMQKFTHFLDVVFFYTPVHAAGWGFSKLFLVVIALFDYGQSVYDVYLSISTIFLLFALLGTVWLTRKKDVVEAIVLVFMALLAFSAFYFPHYLLWALPFVLLQRSRFTFLYTVLSGLFAVVFFSANLLAIRVGDAQNALGILFLLLALSIWLAGTLYWVTAIGEKPKIAFLRNWLRSSPQS